MSSDFSKYFSPRHISSLAKVGNRIKILRGRQDRERGNLVVGLSYTIIEIFEIRPGGFAFKIKENPLLYLRIDPHAGYAAELADRPLIIKETFIAVNPKNSPEDL